MVKKIDIRVGLIYLLIALFIICLNTFIDIYFFEYKIKLIIPSFWLILLLITYKLKIKQKVYNRKLKYQTIFILVTFYLILYFLLGLIVGYGKNPLYLDLVLFIKNIWYFIIPIICQEYIRNIMLDSNRDNKVFIYIAMILFILIDIDLYNNISSINNNTILFKIIFSIILPTIVENILYTYLSLNAGYISVLILRVLLKLINIALPILPNLNWFYITLMNLFLFFIIFISIKNINDKKIKQIRIKKKYNIKYIVFILIFFNLFLFINGNFKYKPISIISNSMYPIIKRGDIVVIDQKNIKNRLRIGDIIAFNSNNSLVIHRIYFIEKHNDGNDLYITKGDNNNTVDSIKIHSTDIKGIVQMKIPKIGYPSVWLNEYLNKGG